MLTQFKSSRQKIFFEFPAIDTKYMGLLKVLTKSCLIWDVGMCGWRGGILSSRISVGITCVTLFQIIYPAAMTTASNAALWGDFYNMWTEGLWGAWEQDTGGVCYNIMGRGKHSFMEQRRRKLQSASACVFRWRRLKRCRVFSSQNLYFEKCGEKTLKSKSLN